MSHYTRTFYILASFYIVYFYIVPLFIISYFNTDGAYFYNINAEKILGALVLLFTFVGGFIFPDLIKKLGSHKKIITKKIDSERLKGNLLFWLLLSIYIIYIIYEMFYGPDIYQSLLVRRGESEGSHVEYLLRVLMSALKILLFVLMVDKRNKWMTAFFLTASLYLDIIDGVGRFVFLINLLVIVLVITGFNAKKSAWFVFAGTGVFMPILMGLKSILFSIATNQELMLSYEVDYDLIVSNFGHPVVSIIQVEELINQVGYRYFYDYIHGFLFYLKAFGFDFGYSLMYYNTYNLRGVYESLVPPGYLAFGYVQLGFVGVFISGIFYRFVGWVFERVIILYKIKNEAAIFLFAFLAANSFYHGEVRVMVMTVFILIIFMIVMSPLKNLKIRLG